MGLPAAWRTNLPLTADTVLISWRSFFTDPQLVLLIEKALEKNLDIQTALKTTEQLDLALRQAKQSLLPALDLSAGASRSWQSKNSLNGSLAGQFVGTPYLDDYSSSLRLTWEADIWGKFRMQQQSARADYFAHKENLLALRTRIIAQVAQAYNNLLALDEQLMIARRNIELSDTTLNMMRVQYSSGRINSLAVEQAEAQKKTAEIIVPLTLQNISIQENSLNILCGSYPDSIARSGLLTRTADRDTFKVGVPAVLLSRRPDVKAAEYAVVSATAKAGLAKAAMYPTLSLSPQIGTNSLRFNQWFDLPGSLTKTLAVNLTQPVFQKRALRTTYEMALLARDKAALQFRQSVMTAVGEVSDAMARSQGASDRLVLSKQKNDWLDNAVNDALVLYRNGMASYFEVITAQNGRLQNELDMINIRLEKRNAVTELYRALGGGIE